MKDLPKIVLTAIISSFLTVLLLSSTQPQMQKIIENEKIVKEESVIIDVVKKTSPSVVSIVVSKNLPKMQSFFPDDFFWPFQLQIPQNNETEKREINGFKSTN